MSALWSFRCYVAPDGTEVIREYHDRQSKKVRARFLSRLKVLSWLDMSEWNKNLYKDLHGNCAGLAEIRFEADKVQQRPLGFRSRSREFTILYWVIEKNWKFVPLSACDRALQRKADVLNGRCTTNAIWLALE